jgi:putative (di)nucleoside polyphosphate hydrolase
MSLHMASHPGGTSAATLPYRRGVGIMLVNAVGLVFVAKRIDMPSDAWQMPQGGIDADETPLAAAKREMFEEIGTDKADFVAESIGWYRYDLPSDLIGKIWGGRYRGQEQKWFVARFTGKDTDINIATEHPEFLDWKWAESSQLPSLIVPFKRQLYADVVREFSGVIAGLRPRAR